MARKRRDAIRTAESLVSRGKLEAAVKEYEKVLRAQPRDTSTLNRVGDLYVRLKRLDQATELFRRAADHFSREGFYVKAIAIFKKIIRLDPTRIDVYETLADLYHRQGLTNEARTQYQVVADYYAQNGDTAKVVSINERMVDLEPDHPTLRVRLAELYRDANRIPDAMQQYREIATFMMAHDKVEEAVKVYQGAIDLDTQDVAYLTDAVMHLKDEGYPEAALKLLAHAEARNPEAGRIGVLTGLIARPPKPAEPVAAVPEDADEGAYEPEPETEAATGLAPTEDFEEVTVEPPGSEAAVVEADALVTDQARAADEDEDPATGPAVFLDLEDAGDLPYAVGREETGEIELDLGEIEPGPGAELVPPAIEPQSELAPLPETPVTRAEHEGEPVVDPLEERADGLFNEAKVLVSYGLEDKAAEVLSEVLDLRPRHLDATALAARVEVMSGRSEAAVALAATTAELADEAGRPAVWADLVGFLGENGYEIEGSVIQPPVVEAVVEPEPEPEPAAEPSPGAGIVEPEIESAPAQDERLGWLTEASGEADEKDAAELFGHEDEFFDLAGELEKELRREDFLDEEFEPQPAEQSLEEIVEGFRKGVAETLSVEDYDTHYNLGIAYREMGLVDEAIGEFQLAAKDRRYLVDCCSLLGACFLEKGFPDLAAKWHKRGLAAPDITEKETLGLLYELGNLYATTGETEAALETFTEVYGTNSNYRDVVARLAELSGGE